MSIEDEDRFLEAIEAIGIYLQKLGLGGAATPMGAVELLAKEIKEGSEAIAAAISHLADAVGRRAEEGDE